MDSSSDLAMAYHPIIHCPSPVAEQHSLSIIIHNYAILHSYSAADLSFSDSTESTHQRTHYCMSIKLYLHSLIIRINVYFSSQINHSFMQYIAAAQCQFVTTYGRKGLYAHS